jgi:hypothetical protein
MMVSSLEIMLPALPAARFLPLPGMLPGFLKVHHFTARKSRKLLNAAFILFPCGKWEETISWCLGLVVVPGNHSGRFSPQKRKEKKG